MDHERFFLLAVVGVLGAISFLMVKPFIPYVLIAAILAFLLHPLHNRLSPKIGERPSAFSLLIFALLVAVIPMTIVTGVVIDDALDFAQEVNRTEVVNTTKLEGYIQDYTGQSVNIEKIASDGVREFTSVTFGSFSRVFNLVTNLLIGFTMTVFLLYYFLKDGGRFISWLKGVTPVSDGIQDDIYTKVEKTTWAVITGHVFVAVAQAVVAGLGLYITGVPNPFFWTFIMVLLGFIPIIGTPVVWIPASAYLFLIERPGVAVFLLVYGTVVVGLTDNILRPIVVDKKTELNPAVILIGVLGGVWLFGASGLFIGPVILGAFKAILNSLKNNVEKF